MFKIAAALLKGGVSASGLFALTLLIFVWRVLPRLIDRLPEIIKAVSDARVKNGRRRQP
jgi:predicted tellurium resistance membrane protein TerC